MSIEYMYLGAGLVLTPYCIAIPYIACIDGYRIHRSDAKNKFWIVWVAENSVENLLESHQSTFSAETCCNETFYISNRFAWGNSTTYSVLILTEHSFAQGKLNTVRSGWRMKVHFPIIPLRSHIDWNDKSSAHPNI